MREFGPAALEDLIPRLRALAAVLDEAHAEGFVHGRLHPRKVVVTDDATFLMGRRVPAGDQLTPAADQLVFAAIAYEWMFGRPVTGPADRPVAVRAIPGVDRGALSQAFTRALSAEPSHRFASCEAFVDAITGAEIPSLPFATADSDEDLVEPWVPEPAALVPEPVDLHPMEPPRLDAIDAVIAAPDYGASARQAVVGEARTHESSEDAPLPAAFAGPPQRPSTSERFGGSALIIATLVGAVFGFAAGYMARPRALQVSEAQQAADPAATTQALEPPTPAPAPKAPAPAPEAPKAPQAPARIGRLLVRSTPSGANVDVDGVPRGTTPLALRDLDLGSKEITVSRRGYVPERTRVALTQARPSRSVEVRLVQATAAKPAETTGGLTIESRPAGAAVTVNGKPRGTTPLTINDLMPGEYRVTMRLAGHREFATTVRVVAGERVRAAARLTEQEQE